MDLRELELTPWNEKHKDDVEEMIVVGDPINKNSRLRLRQGGEVKARPFKRGAPVKLSGDLKKRLYYRLAVCYSKDFKKLDEYLTKYNEKPPLKAVDQNKGFETKEITTLKNENIVLKADLAELSKKVDDLIGNKPDKKSK